MSLWIPRPLVGENCFSNFLGSKITPLSSKLKWLHDYRNDHRTLPNAATTSA